MAVKESLHHATENLILPKPRKLYQASIFNSHWQLRSLIASPEPYVVYYPTSNDIVALNTKKCERETLCSLQFSPRCLTASKDWICIGGEQGNYAAISIKGKEQDSSSIDFDLDALESSDDQTSALLREGQRRLWRFNQEPRRPKVKLSKVGTEIVNCITLWSPGTDATDKAHKAPVAVVSNNDRTVSILDLESSEILQELLLPDYVNRSVISPDGALLATISDDPFLYIHHRQKKPTTSKDRYASKPDPSKTYEWALLCKIQVEGQKTAEKSEMRGSFAACFSRSGQYLAVATQYGLISIFDVATITDAESLVATFTTSRPSTERDRGGAVRAMEFSPGYFDLLAWTESTGRVGVADVRTLFFSRQLLQIDASSEAVERVRVTEKSEHSILDPRLRALRPEPSLDDAPDDPYNPNIIPNNPYTGLDFERRRLRPIMRETYDMTQATHPTAAELEVLQAHGLARQRRDAERAQEQMRELLAPTSPPVPADDSAQMGLPAALRDSTNPDRSTASFRTFINERNQERERRSQQQESRRQSSAMLAAVESAMSRDATVLRNAAGTSGVNDPWAEIEALYRSRFGTSPTPDRAVRLRLELEDEDRRDFAHRLRQPWRPLDDPRRLNLTREERDVLISLGPSTHHRTTSVETMGCCWSEDGQILYAGASDGIYEYHVNVAGRKMFPSLVLR